MAYDAYLKIDGIKGESTDDSHKDEIEILSFSHDMSQSISGTMSTSGGAGAERVNMGAFTVTKLLDLASAKLAEACASGKHIKELEVSLNRAGGDKVEYMNYKLSNVMISSVTVGGNAGGGEALPVETVSFVYGKIEWKYTQQKLADGTGGGNVAAGWDCEKNKLV